MNTAIDRIMPHHQTLAAWFPLVPRSRPACQPLGTRVDHIAALARTAHTRAEASAALNQAALIASDTGAHQLANDLCWRHFDVYDEHAPLHGEDAKAAIEPIINLGRLAIRTGHSDRAHQLFEATLDAAVHATHTTIDTRTIDFSHLTADEHGRRPACQRLWTALLTDGTRALTTAGRWHHALHIAQRHNGIGDRLLHGRQIAILARYHAGDPAAALNMIADSDTRSPWEQAVADYLEALCITADGTAAPTTYANLIDGYMRLELPADHIVFHARLGLSILELAQTGDTAMKPLVDHLAQVVVRTTDAYPARDLLKNHLFVLHADTDTSKTLRDLVAASGLELDALSKPEHQHLLTTAEAGLTRLNDLLSQTAA